MKRASPEARNRDAWAVALPWRFMGTREARGGPGGPFKSH